jgi:hypothetical protein
MAQINSGDWPIDASATTGNELADLLNRLVASVMSGDSGTARPPDIAAGMVWTRANADGSFALMLFRGTADTTLLTVGANGAVTPAGTYTSTEIDNKLSALQTTIQGSTVAGVNAGAGISITGPANGTRVVAHADTSARASQTLPAGQAFTSITLDTYGHITAWAATNFDNRYFTQSEGDGRYLKLSGGAMQGPITMAGGDRRLVWTATGGSTTSPIIDMGNFGFATNSDYLLVTDGTEWVALFDKSATSLQHNLSVVTRQTGDARYGLRTPDVGQIGSYALLRRTSGGAIRPGQVVAGSTLSYASAGGDVNHPGIINESHPPGSWQCMGLSTSYAGNSDHPGNTTLYLRVA